MGEPDANDHAFEERAFYLAEFRGRTLVIAAGEVTEQERSALRAVLDVLSANGNRVVVLTPDPSWTGAGAVVTPDAEPFAPCCWRALRDTARIAVPTDAGATFGHELASVAQKLRPWKLILVHEHGGLELDDGRAPSFVDAMRPEEIRSRVVGERAALLDTVARALPFVGSLNLCSPTGLDHELFTYLGSGTLFTRGRYVAVRDLGIDDLDVAAALLDRGVSEGYLQPREPHARDEILANAVGAFIEERHLAGICGLRAYPEAQAGELVAIYTITRFQGEGIGRHLIARVAERARAQGLHWIFACTTREAVQRFFLREGFKEIPLDELPPEKWADYAPERRKTLHAYRLAVD